MVRSEIFGDGERCGGLRLKLFHADAVQQLLQHQALGSAVKDSNIGDDAGHALSAGERECALGQNLGVALLIGVLHGDDDPGLGGVGDQVHGTTDTRDLAWQHVVGQITVAADLQTTQHGEVDLSGSDHAETLVATEQTGTGVEGDGLLTRVDEIGVFLSRSWVSAHTEDTIFSLEDDFDVLGEIGGCGERNSNTEVDNHAILEFKGGTSDDALTGSGRGDGGWSSC